MDEITLYHRIDRLFADYCSCIDEDRLDEWPGLFVEDGLYKMIARENYEHGFPIPLLLFDSRDMMTDRVFSLREANIYQQHRYRHAVAAVRVTGNDNGVVHVSSSYIVAQTLLEGSTEVYQAGSYYDALVETDVGLRFKERIVVYDTSRVQTLLATPI